MNDAREASRSKMRKRRAEANAEEIEKVQVSRRFIDTTVKKIYVVMRDQDFRKKISEEGVRTIPTLFAKNATSASSSENLAGTKFGDASLDFAVAWSFFYPLSENQAIAAYLNSKWPQFIPELKDAFISLVLNGPFPQECCGIGRPARKPFPSERRKAIQANKPPFR